MMDIYTFLFIIAISVVVIGTVLVLGTLSAGIVFVVKGFRQKGQSRLIKDRKKGFIIKGCVLLSIPILITAFNVFNFVDRNMPKWRFENQAEIVMLAIKNDNAEKIRREFLTDKQALETLDDNIRQVLDFVDGDIVSYEELRVWRNSYGMCDEGAYNNYRGEYNNVVTTVGKKYKIEIYSYIVHKNENVSGVNSIMVTDISDPDSEQKKIIR